MQLNIPRPFPFSAYESSILVLLRSKEKFPKVKSTHRNVWRKSITILGAIIVFLPS